MTKIKTPSEKSFGLTFSIIFFIISFVISRDKYWLIPILILFFLLSGIIFLTQGTAVAPFIYTIF